LPVWPSSLNEPGSPRHCFKNKAGERMKNVLGKKEYEGDHESSVRDTLKSHWKKIYQQSPAKKTGWYEERPEPSLKLIHEAVPNKKSRILHVGAGASTLVDLLLAEGYENMWVNDISEEALDQLRQRLGKNKERIHWIADDLLNPSKLDQLCNMDCWHDRAVLHFFIRPEEQKSYFKLLRKVLRPGGHVIIAVFNKYGARNCSGLPVCRYDAEMLSRHLGRSFKLIKSFDYLYTMPSGDIRPYVYAWFQRETV